MDSSRRTSASIGFLLSVASLISIFLINGMSVTVFAQSQLRREFDNQVPKHLPIMVRIKREKEDAVSDLSNKKWMRDFVLEVTNTGDKPIYYLSLLIVLPGITIPNGTDEMGFSFHYGRRDLHDIETRAKQDDISVKPGETYVFALSESSIKDWERFWQREQKPDAKKLILHFQLLSFGDGTGFVGNDGVAVPHPPDASSSTGDYSPTPDLNDSGSVNFRRVSWLSQLTMSPPSVADSSLYLKGETS